MRRTQSRPSCRRAFSHPASPSSGLHFSIPLLFFSLVFMSHRRSGPVLSPPQLSISKSFFGALMGAIGWNLLTWWGGIPSSSSHALIVGCWGAGLAKGGAAAVVWPGIFKTIGAIVWSPMLGLALALLFYLIVAWLFVRNSPFAMDRKFRVLQMGRTLLDRAWR